MYFTLQYIRLRAYLKNILNRTLLAGSGQKKTKDMSLLIPKRI